MDTAAASLRSALLIIFIIVCVVYASYVIATSPKQRVEALLAMVTVLLANILIEMLRR